MSKVTVSTGQSSDMFADAPLSSRRPAVNARRTPEMTAARALCRQLQRAPERHEKQRLAHLICLNLESMLKHGS